MNTPGRYTMNPFNILLIGCAALLLTSCFGGKKNAGKVKVSEEIRIDPAKAKLREKYAKILEVPQDSITNMKLYAFIDEWYGTHYKWGGTDKSGIDCSAFIQKLLFEVYNIDLPRTSVSQFYTKDVEKFGSKRYLKEGDLVFYQTDKDKPISHVGIYLGHRRFVNAASSHGVSIYNMDDPYWRVSYVGAGRVKVSM